MAGDLNVIHANWLALIEDRGGPRRGKEQGELDLIPDGAVAIRAGRIVAVGPTSIVLREVGGDVSTLNATGKTVFPGFIECHCHPIFAGDRYGEFIRRLHGDSLANIRAEGGGIRSTVLFTRAASDAQLEARCLAAFDSILEGGAATVEAKSGYGLTTAEEIRLLRILKTASTKTKLDVVFTFLGAHILPPDGLDSKAYARLVEKEMLPAVLAQGIAELHDLSCEVGDFEAPIAAALLTRSRELGIPTRVHADASSHSFGWRTAVEGGALAADHLTYTPASEIRELGAVNTIAVLLPMAEQFYFDERKAEARLFVETGVPVALATDYCSTFQATSLALTISLACSWFRLSPAEAIVGATLNAAYALGHGQDRGSLDLGKRGDLTILDCAHPYEMGVRIGAPIVDTVVSLGTPIYHRIGSYP